MRVGGSFIGGPALWLSSDPDANGDRPVMRRLLYHNPFDPQYNLSLRLDLGAGRGCHLGGPV